MGILSGKRAYKRYLRHAMFELRLEAIQDALKERYNRYLRHAMSIACEEHMYDPNYRKEMVQRMRFDAYSYMRDIGHKLLHLQSEVRFDEERMTELDEGMDLCIDYRSRLDDYYRERTIKELEVLLDRIARVSDRFLWLTLTIDPKRHITIKEAGESANASLNRLILWLKYKNPNMKFVAIREFQKESFNIHIHMVVAGIRYIPKADLEREWGEGFVKVERLVEHTINKVYTYMHKEISKSLTRSPNEQDTIGVSDTQVLLWATHGRFFSYSQDLLDEHCKINSRISGMDWTYCGLVDAWKTRLTAGLYHRYEFLARMDGAG